MIEQPKSPAERTGAMSEEKTQDLSTDHKLDLILKEMGSFREALHSTNDRIAALEAKSYDTRPIWERALAELLELKETTGRIEGRLGVVEGGLTAVEGRLGAVEKRLGELEKGQTELKTEAQEIRQQLVNLNREMKQLSRRQDILNNTFLRVQGDWSELEERLVKLEQAAERPQA
jgi:chromosome segregation ATPase